MQNENRKIHLDFHTPYWVKEVGQQFDAEKLVKVWKNAHINAATVVFGLCACGNAYYESEHAPVHPGLKTDMLRELLPAAEREGITIYVHFGPGINDRSVVEHPEWAMVCESGRRLDTNGGKEWGWACFNSPYVTEWFYPQLRDFVRQFPQVAGVFLDMVTYPRDTCYCSHCRTKAVELGLNIHQPSDLAKLWEHTLESFMAEARTIVKEANPDMGFTSNCRWFVGGARSKSLDSIELEAPVSWNSYHYAVMSRYIRNLGIPHNAQTTRFPKNWGYFGSLNNEVQLKYECATILATLGAICIGDHLPASGKPEQAVYDLIGTAYEFVKDREDWALDARTVPYIAILADYQQMVRGDRAEDFGHQAPESLYGAGLTLLEGNRHFDVIDAQHELEPFKLIWLAENVSLDEAMSVNLDAYVYNGGKLLVTGGGLWSSTLWRSWLERVAKVRWLGNACEDGEFFQPVEQIAKDVPSAPMFVKGYFPRWDVYEGAAIVAEAYRPYENIPPSQRYGHFHAPVGEKASYPGAVRAAYGAGEVIVCAAELARDYFRIGSKHVRQSVLNMIDALLPFSEQTVEVHAHSPSVEVSLMEKEGMWVLHLTQYSAKRHTGNTVIEEVPLRYDIPVVLRPQQPPKRVYTVPTMEELEWSWHDGEMRCTVPELHIHVMVVVEW
ncbi:alpha-amylase family protein [Paenibacillus sp. YYML68]|uniref:alpha-amylase family protein n=1 Tax=Paenibacillus sp. YYML68 TaxID=2909250 RepID=UPI002491B260|nr:alpha-amylase family protein [Paenibacillus sp. YYML68]